MRQVFPSSRNLDLRRIHHDLLLGLRDDVAHVAVNMVASIDGAVTIDGRSGALGGDADAVAFRHVRDAANVVLVGAGTVRVEGYGPLQPSAEQRQARVAKGLRPVPVLAVVSGSLDLDPDAAFFSGDEPVIVFTGRRSSAARQASLASVADVHVVDADAVDITMIRSELASRGLGRILCEGGPTLNAALLAADAIDEMFVTIAPVLAGGPSDRIIAGADAVSPRNMSLVSILEHDGELLVRYARRSADVDGT
ncbi:MAG: dihydrofolate reductase family protein [Nitriliruptoraceae bacterium]